MDSIRVETGIKRIQINDGPEFIEFNPSDVVFAERFYQLIKDFEIKQKEYEVRSLEIEKITGKDENGIPNNLPEGLALIREVCEFLKEKIDVLFGKGTSKKVFGDALNLNMFEQFFSGITPFIQVTREEKIAQYIPTKTTGKGKRALMR
jgi:hypothetical protein